MTHGDGPARRDLWDEQGLRPPRHPGAARPAAAPPHHDDVPPVAPVPGLTPGPAADAHDVDAHVIDNTGPDDDLPDDDGVARIDSDVLERARERRGRPGARARRLAGAGVAIVLVAGGAWALTRDGEVPPPPPPAPTLAPDDLASVVDALERAKNVDGLRVVGTAQDEPIVDPRRADLAQPADPAPVTLRSTEVLWTATAAEILADVAPEADVADDALDQLTLVHAHPSTTVADASAPTAVVVVGRGGTDDATWATLLEHAGAGSPADATALAVGVDVASGDGRWARALTTDVLSPCHVLGTGTYVACTTGAGGSGEDEILVLESATGALDARLAVPSRCTPSSFAQHLGVLYWAGSVDGTACLGSGSTLLATWRGTEPPTISVTTDDRVLVRSATSAAVRDADGTWRVFAGRVEPGPAGTLLRTFSRDELDELGPLALRDVRTPGGPAVATRSVTLVSAADGTTLAALPGAAWQRDDLLTGSSVTTPAYLEGMAGVGDWLVDESGTRTRPVHAGDTRFAEILEPRVVAGGVVGSTGAGDVSDVLVVVGDDGLPVPDPTSPQTLLAPYGGGRVGPSADGAPAEPLPGVPTAPEGPGRGPHLMQEIAVLGADGSRRTTTVVVPVPATPDVAESSIPPRWAATGGVVVLPVLATLVGIG